MEEGGKKAIQSTQQDAGDLQEPAAPRYLVNQGDGYFHVPVSFQDLLTLCLGQDPDCKPPSHTDAAHAHSRLQDH